MMKRIFSKNETAWLWINAICAVWSLLLVIEILWTLSPLDRLEGTRAYLSYSFGTTIIWVFEVIVHLWNRKRHPQHAGDGEREYRHETIQLGLELILALYFLLDSTKVFVKWQTSDADVGAELLDSIVGLAAYLYQFVRIRREGEQISSLETNPLPLSQTNHYINIMDTCNEDPPLRGASPTEKLLYGDSSTAV